MKRKPITRDALDVIALYHVTRGDGTPILTRQETVGMEPAEIKALFRARVHIEHMVPHALTGDDHPSNLRFMTPDDHKPKTAADVKAIAKTKRVEKDTEEFRRRILAKTDPDGAVDTTKPKPKAKIRSRGFQKAPDGHKWFNRGQK